MTTRIAIVGGGFAGQAAVRALAGAVRRGRAHVTLYDANAYATMLPALPDVVGGRCSVAAVRVPLSDILPRAVTFRRARVTAIDTRRRLLQTESGPAGYDRLLLAAGSVAGRHNLHPVGDRRVHTLDSLAAAASLRAAFLEHLDRSAHPCAVVAGGGYTGFELARQLRAAAGRSPPPPVTIVEAQPAMLPMMPAWVRATMLDYAAAAGIGLRAGVTIREADGRRITLSDGAVHDEAFLCWTAGARCAIDALEGVAERLPDGRIVVDPFLAVPGCEGVYAAGDAAAIRWRGGVLRRAVNLARGSGYAAGRAIAHSLAGRPPRPSGRLTSGG